MDGLMDGEAKSAEANRDCSWVTYQQLCTYQNALLVLKRQKEKEKNNPRSRENGDNQGV